MNVQQFFDAINLLINEELTSLKAKTEIKTNKPALFFFASTYST